MNFLAGSFPLGRLFDIEIRVHILFVVWIAWRLLTAGSGVADQALFLAMLFGIVLLHEFGHCFGARSVGGDAAHIMMWPLGGLAYAHAPMRPWPQFVTVAAGPAVNVAFCLLSAAAIFVCSGLLLLPGVNPLGPNFFVVREAPAFAPLLGNTAFGVLFTFYHVNLFLLAFNLLPIYPLDGGQIFHAAIWPFVGLQRASIIAAQVGLVGCALLGIYGLTGGGGGILVFIAIFGGFTCWQRYQAAREGWLVEDSAFVVRNPRPGGFWSRLFKTRAGAKRPARPVEFNPNPGGWEAQQSARAEEEAELDRLLRKVSEHGINSLSYVERQKLERITRKRREEEDAFQRETRL